MMMSHEFLNTCDTGEKKRSIQKEEDEGYQAEKHEKWLLLSHEDPVVSHDRLEYVVLR
jgi:hypothetical protein